MIPSKPPSVLDTGQGTYRRLLVCCESHSSFLPLWYIDGRDIGVLDHSSVLFPLLQNAELLALLQGIKKTMQWMPPFRLKTYFKGI